MVVVDGNFNFLQSSELIIEDEQDKEVTESIGIQYPSIPPHCFKCMRFGHYVDECRSSGKRRSPILAEDAIIGDSRPMPPPPLTVRRNPMQENNRQTEHLKSANHYTYSRRNESPISPVHVLAKEHMSDNSKLGTNSSKEERRLARNCRRRESQKRK